MRSPTRLFTAVVALGLAVSCSGSTTSGNDRPGGTLVVFAASSLTHAFGEIGSQFEAANPDVRIVFNFAGSNDLVNQILQGAPADLVVTADEQSMTQLVAAGQVAGEAVTIASNTMAILVEAGNPAGVVDLSDLADGDLIVVLCSPSVPCGAAAASLLQSSGVTVTPRSYENRVTGVVTKVVAGEADAGIVFVTDALAAAEGAQGIEIPADINVVTRYPLVRTAAGGNAELALEFIEFVTGAAGRTVLASYGFGAP